MQGFMQDFRRKLRYLYIQALGKVRPVVDAIQSRFSSIINYFKTHPRIRKWTLILGPPAFLFLLLMVVVLIETPSNRRLRNIKNQVASEVFSADSVLLGRYYTQDRTEV